MQMGVPRDIDWLTARPIAHRGLHDAARGIHENSMSAFRAAIEGGYAIECDIRLSSDSTAMVFHDAELDRMTGAEGLVHERTAETLSGLSLRGSDDRIPSFGELLQLAAGRVPLVVEMKGVDPDRDAGFAQALRPLVEAYEGPLALMSFDAWLIDEATTLADRVPVGLTAEGTRPDVLARHRDVFADRCSFTSYNVHHLDNPFVRWVREERGMPVISWTVRTPDDERKSRAGADQITFEGFVPQG